MSAGSVDYKVEGRSLREESGMTATRCDICGFMTEEPLTVAYHGRTTSYCCFECAITELAPECTKCHCKIIGHGSYGQDGHVFCSHHCRQESLSAIVLSRH